MTVKEFLSVCEFVPYKVKDRSNNILFLNGSDSFKREWPNLKNEQVLYVTNNNGHIVICIDSYGY